MKETSRVHRYTVLFREAADELNWPNIVLHRLYYNGLPDRIKDLWARTDPPADFEDLVPAAKLDALTTATGNAWMKRKSST